MDLPFVLQPTLDSGPNQFRIYETVSGKEDDWLLPLARAYLELLTRFEAGLKNVLAHATDLPVDSSTILRYVKKASVPKYRPGNFNVVRCDFGELLTYLLLERDYKTLIGNRSIRYRELRDASGRGIDAIGVESGESLNLVLCEVKVSDDELSPPGVVDSNNDGLGKQQQHHLDTLFTETKDKIWRASQLTTNIEISSLLLAVALSLEEKSLDKLNIIACCVLVRPKERCKVTDFGSFLRNPSRYAPASIRFLIPCLPDRVDGIIKRWYETIQKLEVSM